MGSECTSGSTDNDPDQIKTFPPPSEVGNGPTFRKGSGYFPITMQWRVLSTSTIHDFPVQNQEDEIFTDGKVENRKGDHSEHANLNDDTSHDPWGEPKSDDP